MLKKLLDYKIGTSRCREEIRTDSPWIYEAQDKKNACHFDCATNVKMKENIQSWWDTETYTSEVDVVRLSKKELQAQKRPTNTAALLQPAVWSRNAVELTTAYPNNQMQLSLGWSLLIMTMIPKGPKN